MKKPTDNSRRPARRFSAIKPPVRRPAESGQRDDLDPAPAAPDAVEPDAPAPAETLAAAGAARVPAAPAPEPRARAGEPLRGADEARVAKVMSRAGLCSRREAEAWINSGRVAVNGAVIESPALNIGPDDRITVDGYPIDKPDHTRLFMFHKTRGLVTTARDPEGRPTVFDVLPAELPRLMTIGRLDINTEGLLLLTNDGGLARLLELPATGWLRRYRVRANGRVEQGALDALARGVTVDGVDYAGIDAKLDRIQGANLWLTLGLREGKNREVKRVLEHLGLAVTRLIRISFGPFQLGDLAENAVEEVRTRVLRDQLGSALARQAGLDLRIEEGDSRPAPAPADLEPRRKTSRSATADRRGRPVAVERITRTDRPQPDRGAPAPAAARSRGSSRDERVRRPAQGAGPAAGRPREASDLSGRGRPARTLRQADADASRRDDPRPRRGAGEDRPADRGPRRGAGPGRAERFKDAERPRTGRNKDEPGPRRSASRAFGPARSDERSRGEPRARGSAGAGPGGGGRPAPGAVRPGGKPSAGSGGKPPGRPGKPSGGGGRPRPRG